MNGTRKKNNKVQMLFGILKVLLNVKHRQKLVNYLAYNLRKNKLRLYFIHFINKNLFSCFVC